MLVNSNKSAKLILTHNAQLIYFNQSFNKKKKLYLTRRNFEQFLSINARGCIHCIPKIPPHFCIAMRTIKTGQFTSNIAYGWPVWGDERRQIDLSPVEKPAHSIRGPGMEIKTIKCLSRYLFDSINLSMASW